jgi:hypothetical protein
MRRDSRVIARPALGSLFLVLLVAGTPALTAETEASRARDTVLIPIEAKLPAVAAARGADPVHVRISIYEAKDATDPLWFEEQFVTPDESGACTLSVGATVENGVPAELFTSGRARWIGVAADGEAEGPRTMIVTVPYAAKARDAQTIAGHTVAEIVRSKEFKEALRSVLTDGLDPQQLLFAPAAPASPAPVRLRPQTNGDPGTPAGLFEHMMATGATTGVLGRAVSTTSGNVQDGVTGVRGEIGLTSAGAWSSGVRGINSSTTSLGVGVIGYQAGSGYGVYGETLSGFGVFGLTRGETSAAAGVLAKYGGTGTGTALVIDNGMVKVAGTNRFAFTHTVTSGNSIAGSGGTVATLMSHPFCNGDPSAFLIATPVIGDTTFAGPVGVVYLASYNAWALWSLDATVHMPLGAKFNVLVIKTVP